MQKSNTMANLFPDELLVEVFGTSSPSMKEKHRYFFDQWMQWKNNRWVPGLVRNASNHGSIVRKKLTDLGLREFWDYQLRPGEIRFASPEYLAMWKLANDL